MSVDRGSTLGIAAVAVLAVAPSGCALPLSPGPAVAVPGRDRPATFDDIVGSNWRPGLIRAGMSRAAVHHYLAGLSPAMTSPLDGDAVERFAYLHGCRTVLYLFDFEPGPHTLGIYSVPCEMSVQVTYGKGEVVRTVEKVVLSG